MSITRKEFLMGLGAGVLGAMVPGSAWPVRLDEKSFPDLMPGFPTVDEIWAGERYLADLCPVFTGSPSHVKFLDYLEKWLRDAKLTLQRKTFTLPYWELKDYGVKVGSAKIPVPGYRPYSGATDASGVTAPLYYAGAVPPRTSRTAPGPSTLDYSGARGKIVLIDVPVGSRSALGPGDELLGTRPASEHDSVTTAPFMALFTTPAPDLKPAEDAGAVGVIYIWNGISDANAQDQALPFSAVPGNTPTVWVGNAAGKKLKSHAASGASATLTLHAVSHPDTPTDNLWAVLPGVTDETIIINTHTDGCNACEENGAIGVVALAKYFAKIPQSQRQRTLVFLMTTGHFAHGYVHGTADWMASNPDLMKKAVACVTIEHLGAWEYEDNPITGVYKPTGKYEWSTAYTPLRPEGDVFLKAAEGTEEMRSLVNKPANSYPGEGSGFWRAGIPTISYISNSIWLMTAPPKDGQIAKMDKKRMHGQIATLGRCVAKLDKMSVADIRGTDEKHEGS